MNARRPPAPFFRVVRVFRGKLNFGIWLLMAAVTTRSLFWQTFPPIFLPPYFCHFCPPLRSLRFLLLIFLFGPAPRLFVRFFFAPSRLMPLA